MMMAAAQWLLLLGTVSALHLPTMGSRGVSGTVRRSQSIRAAADSVEGTIQAGGRLPEIEVVLNGDDGGRSDIRSVLGSGQAILLGMPGAFTPTCNDRHLPGYIRGADELRRLNVRTIACITTNDRWTNEKWQADLESCLGMNSSVLMLSDPTGDLSEALGLIGYLGKDLGVRSKRFGARHTPLATDTPAPRTPQPESM
jgi:peroxiredoxin